MNSISTMFKEFVDFCHQIRVNTPASDRISSMFGLPVSIKLEDLEDYFEYRNDKVTVCVQNLKHVTGLKKMYPHLNFTSPRQNKRYDADLLVVMDYSKYDDNEKRCCENFNRDIKYTISPDYLVIYIG